MRAASPRRMALALDQAFSIGFKSGEYGEKFKSGAERANESGDLGILVNSKVVPDHDVGGPEERGEAVAHPNTQCLGVHRSWQQHWSVKTPDRQSRNDCESPTGGPERCPRCARRAGPRLRCA